jgi:F-type H+-transporting ATPase subunit b
MATGEADPRSDSLRYSLRKSAWRHDSGSGRSARVLLVAAVISALSSAVFPVAARASESLDLIPDYAFFDLLKLGLIPDESGMGALWVMLILFALLAIPLNALLFQPIFRALDARAERIQGARVRSEHLQREADSILERYEAAIREVRAEAEAARQVELGRAREEQVVLTSQVKQESERQLENARAELARSLESARSSLRASAEELARSAAEQVLGRALS